MRHRAVLMAAARPSSALFDEDYVCFSALTSVQGHSLRTRPTRPLKRIADILALNLGSGWLGRKVWEVWEVPAKVGEQVRKRGSASLLPLWLNFVELMCWDCGRESPRTAHAHQHMLPGGRDTRPAEPFRFAPAGPGRA